MLVGEGGGEHRSQARPICDSQNCNSGYRHILHLHSYCVLGLRAIAMDI